MFSSHVVNTVKGETTMPVSIKVETIKLMYTGGDLLQLPLPVQTLMKEYWRDKVQNQKRGCYHITSRYYNDQQ